MKIFLHNYAVRPQHVLKRTGYKLREKEKDYIRKDADQGRFHARIIDSNTIDIHYDLFVDNKHWSPPTPIKHNMERGRIFGAIRNRKVRELKPGEFQKLLARYGDIM